MEAAPKRFSTKVNVSETKEKVAIEVELIGHKFAAEALDVQVVDGDVLIVKAEDGERKFERKFRMPANAKPESIECRFKPNDKEKDDSQILNITIPRAAVTVTPIPVSIDE